MKILFISNLFPDAGQPIRGLDNATLLHYLHRQHSISVLGLRPRRPWQGKPGIHPRDADTPLNPQYQHVGYIPLLGSGVNHRILAQDARKRIRRILQEFQPDVILASWMYPDCCGLALLKKQGTISCPIIGIAQGTDIHTYLNNPIRRKAILQALPQLSGVITRSADLANRIHDAGWQGNNIHPVYNGIDTALFRPRTEGEAPPQHLNPTERNIIFIGNLYPVKAPDRVIQAFALAMSRLSDETGKLFIIGDGTLRDRLPEWCSQNNVEKRVLHLGRIPAEQVAHYLRFGDALLMASLNEGVPNVVLEAFASGVPVISTDVGGIHEVLVEGVHGQLAPPGETSALGAMLAATLAEDMDRKAIRLHGEKFTWENTARQYEKILEQALDET